MADQLNSLPPELQVEYDSVKRRQALADALLQQGLQGPSGGRMVGRYYVPASPLEGLASAVQTGVGTYLGKKNDQAYKDLGTKYNTGLANAVQQYQTTKAGQPAIEQPPEEIGGGPGRTAIPGDAQKAVREALTSSYAPLREMGKIDLTHQNRQEDLNLQAENLRLQRKQSDERTAERQAATNQARLDLLTTKMQNPSMDAQERNRTAKEIAELRASTEMYKADAKTRAANPAAKPIPAPAMKMQQEALDAIGTASSINADLGQVKQQVDNKELNLSLANNVFNNIKTWAGYSTPEGVKLQSFKNTLEKLRNDSLRLNKGVQTEGDSVRAWNELLSNINDQKYVSARLAEIQRMNERAVELHRSGINILRSNYGHAPIDLEAFTNQPGTLGGTAGADTQPPPAPNPRAGAGASPYGAPPPGAVRLRQ